MLVTSILTSMTKVKQTAYKKIKLQFQATFSPPTNVLESQAYVGEVRKRIQILEVGAMAHQLRVLDGSSTYMAVHNCF